jgi:hypothetical protein
VACIWFASPRTVKAFAWAWAGDGGMGALAVHGLVFAGCVADLATVSIAFEVFQSGALFCHVGEPVAAGALLVWPRVGRNAHVDTLCIHVGPIFG